MPKIKNQNFNKTICFILLGEGDKLASKTRSSCEEFLMIDQKIKNQNCNYMHAHKQEIQKLFMFDKPFITDSETKITS